MKKIYIATIMLSAVMMSCNDEGPMEKAGKQMDNAIENAGEAIEEAAENVEEAVEEEADKDRPMLDSLKAKTEKAGEKIGGALNKLKDKE